MGSGVSYLLDMGGRRRFAWLGLLSLLGAATEGFGFVLLVPLLGGASGNTAGLPQGLPLAHLELPVLLGLFVVLVVLRALAEVARRLAAQDLRVAVVDGLRMRAVGGLLHAEWRWLARQRQGDLEALLISNIDRTGYAIDLFASLLRLALGLAALGFAAFAIAPRAAVWVAAAGVLVLLLFLPLRRRARRLGEELTRQYEALHSRLDEVLGALRVVKSFGRESQVATDLDSQFGNLRHAERAYIRDSALAQAGLQIAGALAAAVLAWLALAQLGMPLAKLLPLAAIFVRALPMLGELIATGQAWSHASPALESAHRLIDAAARNSEPALPAGTRSARLARAIRFEGVHVGHGEGRPALEGVDLEIAAGTLVALTGASGAGKSTLADLAGGLIAPDRGIVAIDEAVLDDAARRSWRGNVAYVQQEPVLFSGTVRENLLWANHDADEELLCRALAEASAGFVHALPGGLDCDLGEGGRALSGGERQRIALARALLRDPDLILLDEATSAVDTAAEEAIASALRAMTPRRTVIAITHRGIVRDTADRVITLDRGRLA